MNLNNAYKGKYSMTITRNRLYVYWDNPSTNSRTSESRVADVSLEDIKRLSGYSSISQMKFAEGSKFSLEDILFNPIDAVEFFGLSGIEYGKYLNEPERYVFQIVGVTALVELAKILKIKPVDIGMRNYILMSYGARGKGRSKILAHFAFFTGEINLTNFRSRLDNIGGKQQGEYRGNPLTRKKRGFDGGGSGSLAHEYAHAIDYLIQKTSKDLITGFGSPYMMTDYFLLFYRIKAILVGYIKVPIKKDGKVIPKSFSLRPIYRYGMVKTDAEISKLPTRTQYQKIFKVMMEICYLGPTLKRFTRLNKDERKESGSKNYALFKKDPEAVKFITGSEEVTVKNKPVFELGSSGYLACQGTNVNYWGQPHEMWARSFEEYTRRKATKDKLKPNFLLSKEKYQGWTYYGESGYSKKNIKGRARYYQLSLGDPQDFNKDLMPLFDKFCSLYGKSINTILNNFENKKQDSTISITYNKKKK